MNQPHKMIWYKKNLSIQSQDAFGKNKDMNIVPTQKYEKIIPIEKNSNSIDKQ